MNAKDREIIHRALGIIEGVAYKVDDDVSDALTIAVEMIDAVILKETDHD